MKPLLLTDRAALFHGDSAQITPPGGTVLDIFAGSGTTGVAALEEGMSVILVEQGGEDGEYLPIVEGRIRNALNALEQGTDKEAA